MPMTRWDRKAELARKNVRQSVIARRLGVSDTAVSDVVTGRSRSARIEAAIAAAIGRPIAEVFPPRDDAPTNDAPSSAASTGVPTIGTGTDGVTVAATPHPSAQESRRREAAGNR